MNNVYMYEAESWSMKKDTIYEARIALETGLENTEELLIKHDIELGRTTRSNRSTAEILEKEILSIKSVIEKLKKPDGVSY